jgi:PUA domain protein
MFKKDLTAGSKSKVKSSVARGIRSKVLETYPALEPHIEEIMPKKGQLDIIKLPDRVSLYSLDDRPLFWQHMDDPIIPHLKVVHQFPAAFKTVGIDRGAIRFVLSGAKGGDLPPADKEVKNGEVVVVNAEGKEEACLVGVLEMGTEEMKKANKGVAMANGHFLGDGLWKMDLS